MDMPKAKEMGTTRATEAELGAELEASCSPVVFVEGMEIANEDSVGMRKRQRARVQRACLHKERYGS